MIELILSLFGISRANNLSSIFLFGMAITVPTVALILTIPEIYQAENDSIFNLKIVSAIWAANDLISMILIKVKGEKILEIYDELNYYYLKLKDEPSGYFHSSVTWVIYHVVLYLLVVISSFGSKDILFDFFKIILHQHHVAITAFYWSTWNIAVYQVYCVLNIRYLYLVEMQWKRLEKVYIKPSYYLILEIRQTLESLKVSEKNLGDATYFIIYFVFSYIIIFTVFIYLSFNFELTLSYYVPYLTYKIFILVNFISFYLYIQMKRKCLAKVEERLSIWNY